MSPVGKVVGSCLLLGAVGVPSLAFTGTLPVFAGKGCRPSSHTRAQQRAHHHTIASRRPRSALDMNSAMAGTTTTTGEGTMSNDEEDGGGNMLAAIRPLTEGSVFIGVQAVFVLAVAGLVDAGFSGDWQARGLLSDAVAEIARSACYATAAAHAVLTGASVVLARAKGTNIVPALLTILTGPLGLLKVTAMYDEEELEAIAAAKAPPLSMAINSMEFSSRQTPAAVMLSTSIKARKSREGAMRKLLEKLVEETTETAKDTVFTCTVNQDPEERTTFFMLQRFASPQAMAAFQNSEPFQTFTDGAEDCVAEPMGLYLVNERSGKLSEPVHPFGPGGEGGRDDAIYSSPANLQGSLRDNF